MFAMMAAGVLGQQGAAAGDWSPATSPNLRLWLDMSDSLTVDGSGYVTQLDDKGPGSWTYTPASPSTNITVTTMNGLNALRVVSPNNPLSSTDGSLAGLYPNHANATADNFDITMLLVYDNTGASRTDQRGFNFSTASTITEIRSSFGSLGKGGPDSVNLGTVAAGPHLVTMWRDGLRTVNPSRRIHGRLDGTEEAVNTGSDFGALTDEAITQNQLTVGPIGSGADWTVAELIVLSGYGEVDDAETYLADKWGITL